MRIFKIILTFLGIAAILAVASYFYYQNFYAGQSKNDIVFKTINQEVSVHVEYARTPEEQAKGLSGRQSLGAYNGMLFVFPQEAIQAFWMKDMQFPLDIIFINKDKHIVDIVTMQPCTTDPCPVYKSKAPAQFVIEVNSGFAERNGFGVTDQVILPENTFLPQ